MNVYANLHHMTAISTNAIFAKIDSYLSKIIPSEIMPDDMDNEQDSDGDSSSNSDENDEDSSCQV